MTNKEYKMNVCDVAMKWRETFTNETARGVWITVDAEVDLLVRVLHSRYDLALPSDYLYSVTVDCLDYLSEEGSGEWLGDTPTPVYCHELARLYGMHHNLIDAAFLEVVDNYGFPDKVGGINGYIGASIEYIYTDCLGFLYAKALEVVGEGLA